MRLVKLVNSLVSGLLRAIIGFLWYEAEVLQARGKPIIHLKVITSPTGV